MCVDARAGACMQTSRAGRTTAAIRGWGAQALSREERGSALEGVFQVLTPRAQHDKLAALIHHPVEAVADQVDALLVV